MNDIHSTPHATANLPSPVSPKNMPAAQLNSRTLRKLDRSKTQIERELERQSQCAFAIGKLLIEAKSNFQHGRFLDWIDVELPFGRRMGQIYMRIAQVLSDDSASLAKFQLNTLSTLSLKALSDDARRAVVADIIAGRLATDQSVLEKIQSLLPSSRPQTSEQAALVRLQARTKAARLMHEIAGDQINDLIGLLRQAGFSDFADTLEEIATEPFDEVAGVRAQRDESKLKSLN